MVSFSHETKTIVAENCYGYTSRNIWDFSNLRSISQSCDSCSNFVKGDCKKGLFEGVASSISIN